MKLLEQLSVQHQSHAKQLELYHGDLTDMPPEQGVDVLVISTWPGDYEPYPGTVIGALHRKGISVAQLAQNKAADLRQTFFCWLSPEISSPDPGIQFKRILCFEHLPEGQPAEVVGDILQSLMPFMTPDLSIKKIAIPLLVTGQQGVPIADILEPLFGSVAHWLELGLPIEALKIVEISELKAAEIKGAFSILKRQFAREQQMGSSTYKYDIFVSYSHTNSDEVFAIVDQLQALRPRLRIFVDRQALNTGAAWQQELYEALDDCEKVVAVYSPAYLVSKVCKEEFNIALFRHRDSEKGVLVPIYLQDANLPTYMKLIQYIDFRGKTSREYRPLCEQLLSTLWP
jgi:hypothetical protein